MDSGSVVADLKRLISAEGRSLLQSHNLLRPLVEQMVTSVAIADVAVTEGLDAVPAGPSGTAGFRVDGSVAPAGRSVWVGRTSRWVGQLRRLIQRQTFMRDQFAPKAEARFLERKNELDQVVYSLLRLKNSFLARELYLQIESDESNFSDLAKRYAEGPERNTNGIIGPVSLTQAHPVLVEKLRVAQPGVLLEPFPIADWWLVVRLERYSPATFTEEVADQMCREMFNAWIAEETTSTLSRLAAESSDFAVS